MIKRIIRGILPYGLVRVIQNSNQKNFETQVYATQKIKIEALLASGNPLYLELGARDKKGSGNWVTMDLNPNCDIPCNLLERLSFPNDSVSKIYSSHFLEHFGTKHIQTILSECYRVLKPGGWISACVPDGSVYVNAYTNKSTMDPSVWLRYKPAAIILSEIDYVNYMAYLGDEHKHLFDIDNLCALFRDAGFKEVKPRKMISGLDMEVRDYQSIYAEGIK